jgi:SAM-dependent methyltransferase
MATDIAAILRNLESFYDFADKSVLHVGAGGGQFIGYAANARSVLAVDPDPAAVALLETAIRDQGLEDRLTVLQREFESVEARVDIVFLEFCLHEMDDPATALLHARSVAPEILVLDHEPQSPWAWYTCETEKAERSWASVRRGPIVRESTFEAVQRFRDYSELHAKIRPLGAPALARIRKFEGRRDISIEMKYAVALLGAELPGQREPI